MNVHVLRCDLHAVSDDYTGALSHVLVSHLPTSSYYFQHKLPVVVFVSLHAAYAKSV